MYELVTIGSQQRSYLSQKAIDVPKNEDVSKLLDAMADIMFDHKGAGLAANQVGVLKRVIVIITGAHRYEIINPVITKRYNGRGNSTERCLSFPEQEVKMQRYKRIIVEGFDRDWNPVEHNIGGFAAKVVQHEVDHLNGITIS